MSLEINEYFKSQYLTCGNTSDNLVFYDCPRELLDYAEHSLSQSSEQCMPCIIKITSQDEDRLAQTLNNCSSDYEKMILARTYYYTRFMRELVAKSNRGYKDFDLDSLDNGIEMLVSGSVESAKKYYVQSPFIDQIEGFIKNLGKIELDIMLDNTRNVFLQKAINNSLSARSSYSVKIFNTKDRFVTPFTENGQLVEAIHDFSSRNVRDYVKVIKDDMVM